MPVIVTKMGKQVQAFIQGRSFWLIKKRNNDWLCELDHHVNVYDGVEREMEWYDDVVKNGDVLQIKELWLFCPPMPGHPFGERIRMVIDEPGTAFQMKGAQARMYYGRYPTFQMIGKVTSKEEGTCDVYVYDYITHSLYHYYPTVASLGTWREGLGHIGKLNLEAIGLRLE